jgi:hypothetical protein
LAAAVADEGIDCDWLSLQHSMPVSMLSYKGDLHVSLKFACSEGLPSLLSPGELHVVIHEARNSGRGQGQQYVQSFLQRVSVTV